MGKRARSERMRTPALLRPFNPGLQRQLSITEPSADRCKVSVLEEGVTLVFERTDKGIRRIGYEIDDPDIANPKGRVSYGAFEAARQRAVRQMNALRGKQIQQIETRMDSVPVVYSANFAECVLIYGTSHYEYFCPVDEPLTWQSLKYVGSIHWVKKVFLSDEEARRLKQMAFGVLQGKRRGTYTDDGLGYFVETPQLKLALA